MKLINVQFYKTKIGELILGAFEGKLCLVDYRYRKMRKTIDNRIKNGLNADFVEQNDKILDKTKQQIEQFLLGKSKVFDLPLLMVGTEFQKSVWLALMKVSYGTTLSYQQLANNINKQNAVRAVASANGANSIAIIIPCHRIIASDGQLVGYAGGLSIKKRLLNLEKSNLTN